MRIFEWVGGANDRIPQIAKKYGWKYKGTPGWRSRIISHTNITQAHNSGRYAQQQRVKKFRPYLRYRHSPYSLNARKEHLAWDGTVLPQEHEFWNAHTPMNGWGCNCYTETLSGDDLTDEGITVSEDPKPEYETKTVNNKPYKVPKGIDPGFEYNPGKASFGQFVEKIDNLPGGNWKALPGQKTAGDYGLGDLPRISFRFKKTIVGTKKEALETLSRSLGEPIYQTKIGGFPVTIDAGYLVEHLKKDRWQYLENVKTLLENKDAETWLTFQKHKQTGKIALRMSVLGKFKDKKGILVLDVVRGVLNGYTFFPARKIKELEKRRLGIYFKGNTK